MDGHLSSCLEVRGRDSLRDAEEEGSHGEHHDERRNTHLLQGLGRGTADCFLSRLAVDRGRLGRANAVLRAARLSCDCARPAGSWPLQPDVGRQRDGHLFGRSRSAIRKARPQKRHHGGAFHGWRRGGSLSGPSRHQARRQSGVDERRAAADAEDGEEPRRLAGVGVRRHTGRSRQQSSGVLQGNYTSVLRIQPRRAQRFPRASGSIGGCRG